MIQSPDNDWENGPPRFLNRKRAGYKEVIAWTVLAGVAGLGGFVGGRATAPEVPPQDQPSMVISVDQVESFYTTTLRDGQELIVDYGDGDIDRAAFDAQMDAVIERLDGLPDIDCPPELAVLIRSLRRELDQTAAEPADTIIPILGRPLTATNAQALMASEGVARYVAALEGLPCPD